VRVNLSSKKLWDKWFVLKEGKLALSEKLAHYARDLSFTDLSSEEVHGVKRFILDTLACAVGGYDGDSSKIIRSMVEELGGPRESTVVGCGTKVPCANAALANGAMVRYLDYNDSYLKMTEKFFTGWHPNELIPAALAIGERQHVNGRDLITAVALSYEIIGRFVDSITVKSLSNRGWHMATLAGFVVPLYVGKLLKLTQEQMVNAIGIAGTHTPTLGAIDAPGEEYNMTKNIGVPFVARNSIIAALLAQKGFTGPKRVIEGNRGIIESVLAGDFDTSVLLKSRDYPTISQTIMKYFPAETCAQGALTALIKLANDHNILPEQVKKIRIEVDTRGAEHIGDPAKRYPHNKETADHSLYYLAAIAIVDRAVSVDSYTEDKFTDPTIRSLIERVTVEANPEFDTFRTGGTVHIFTTDNQQFMCRVNYPKGHFQNPMTDEEIGEKFTILASRFMNEKQIRQIINAVYHLEDLDDIGKLMKMLIFKNTVSGGENGEKK